MSDSLSFQSFISSLEDPREPWKTRYPLDEAMLLRPGRWVLCLKLKVRWWRLMARRLAVRKQKARRPLCILSQPTVSS